MLSMSVVAFLLLAVTGAAVLAKFSWTSLIVSFGVLEVLGFVLLGLPGGAFLESLEPIMQGMGRGPISGDGAWPAAIMMSLVWPFALGPAYLAARRVQLSNGQRGLVALAVLVSACFLIGALIYAMVS
jgi:hypothetical protein